MNQVPLVYPVSHSRFDARSFKEKGYAYIDHFLPAEIHKKIHGTLTSEAP